MVPHPSIDVRREPIDDLAHHAAIPIAFQVESEFVVLADGRLEERRVTKPWRKNYDALDGGPAAWAARFETSSWGLFGAYRQDKRVGGEVVFVKGETATLWDLRIVRSERRRGVGTALFRAALEWASQSGARRIDVETQNINVPACRFYARMGCECTRIEPDAYPDLPNETRLVWSRAC